MSVARATAHRPVISFAVTCYNQEGCIERAIAGALAQDYEPLEIIISDDASTDGSMAVIHQCLAGYRGPHRVTVNRNPRNLGIAGHYDRLSELAEGELIVCADGDDVSLPHRARRYADAWFASGRKALLIHGPCLMQDPRGNDRGIVRPPAAMRGTPDPKAMIDHYFHVIGANFGWTKQLYRHFGPMARHALIDDHVLPFRAVLLGDLAYIDEPLVRKFPGGMADLAVAETGYDRLFGLHLKELPWKIADYRQFEADLERIDTPDRDDLVAAARRRRALYQTDLRMALASPARRLAMVPGEALRAVRARSRARLRSVILYAGAPVTTWVIDMRIRRARRKAATSGSPQPPT